VKDRGQREGGMAGGGAKKMGRGRVRKKGGEFGRWGLAKERK